MEVWKQIPNYPTYEASNTGRVRSIDRIDCIGRHRKGKILCLGDNRTYFQVMLFKDRIRNYPLVHQVIANTFLGEKLGYQVNHIDGNKRNNHSDNLEWVTASKNQQHALRTGLRPRGEKVNTSKLSMKEVIEIRKRAKKGERGASLAREFKITKQNIYKVIKGKYWSHISI